MSNTEYDAIVVGSGITGGWAAKELTERGLRVLLLERGYNVEHGKDYQGEHKGWWEFKFRNQGDRKVEASDYPVQSTTYAFGEDTKQFFVNDKENPYIQEKPFSWIRGYHLGGRSLTWARQSYRWGTLNFEENARDGVGVDWPIRYEDLAPWYDHVEEHAGISGRAEGLAAQLPDGKFLPPMQMTCAELQVQARLVEAFPERTMTIGRTAVLTRDHKGRSACHHCLSSCHRGCSTGSYFSTQSSTLPPALATGRLTVRTDSVVHSVVYDATKDKATGVRVVDRTTKETTEFSARVIFLCASTLGSTQILLNSRTPRFPTGLGNSSDVLGRYLMDHIFSTGAWGLVPGNEDKSSIGHRPNGIYIPRFQNLPSSKHRGSDREYLRGYGLQGGSRRLGWDRGTHVPGFGADLKAALRDPGPWYLGATAFGEMLPDAENRVTLDANEVDAWGIPLLKVRCVHGENEKLMSRRAAEEAAEMFEAAGMVNVETYDREHPPGLGIHEMGTARMGRDPKTSVLNAWNQVHDASNVFVTDGACMTSSACQNPSLTYMALTARAAHYAADKMQRGEL